MNSQTPAFAVDGRRLTTEEFATAISCLPDSIRKRYSQTGSYHGVRPVKLPNRRLLWPADALEQLIGR
ncbi:DNA-binding protein [Paraburkholderia madseniana]|uniref:DNA-binding protein n=1 Tax=Paraburkholderia madseniana TaxID=2599607 RepID=A0A6N6WLE1_9BURK|nr:DNA-binding protein [Paraburkholderia madseniana]KAE8760849.1 DNA-binding protein [Paraburkholderia madseniana]